MNIGTHQREAEENSGWLAWLTGADERWSVEGFLRMKPLEMAVIERSIEGKRGREALGGTESRRDLPVRFRCGKCWLPVDSIRASSGSHVKGWGSEERRGEQKSKEEEQV